MLNEQTTLLINKECQLADPFTLKDNDSNLKFSLAKYSKLSSRKRARKKRIVLHKRAKNVNLRFIVPTSNTYERLFSVAAYARSDHR